MELRSSAVSCCLGEKKPSRHRTSHSECVAPQGGSYPIHADPAREMPSNTIRGSAALVRFKPTCNHHTKSGTGQRSRGHKVAEFSWLVGNRSTRVSTIARALSGTNVWDAVRMTLTTIMSVPGSA
eukprot:2631191-Rhodomonas_salina.1